MRSPGSRRVPRVVGQLRAWVDRAARRHRGVRAHLIRICVPHPRRTAPHGSMRQYLIPGHDVPLAPPICSDDFGAALYISPPP